MRPKVTVNCACSADGKLASRLRRQVSISGPEDMARVHRLRAGSDAVLVGVGTVADDVSETHDRLHSSRVKGPCDSSERLSVRVNVT